MNVNSFSAKYEHDFISALQSIQVTDANNVPLTFAEGIEKSVQWLKEIEAKQQKLMLVGNGGSAGITSHMALDFWKNAHIKATAFNDSSLLTAVANDYSFDEVFSKPIERFADSGDVLMAISASGNSKNILNAANAAKQKDCIVITFSGFGSDNHLRTKGDLNFYVDSLSYGLAETIHAYIIHAILDAKLYCFDNVDIFNRNKPI